MTLKPGRRQHRKYLPYAFTEQGVAMLSSVLDSDRAIAVNIEIMRSFVKLRELLVSNKELARRSALNHTRRQTPLFAPCFAERLPEDFLFGLSAAEVETLNRSQIGTGSQKHRNRRFRRISRSNSPPRS